MAIFGKNVGVCAGTTQVQYGVDFGTIGTTLLAMLPEREADELLIVSLREIERKQLPDLLRVVSGEPSESV
ncbi:MAG: hypothetical protein R2826_03570 [Thermoleophilia bacterium]